MNNRVGLVFVNKYAVRSPAIKNITLTCCRRYHITAVLHHHSLARDAKQRARNSITLAEHNPFTVTIGCSRGCGGVVVRLLASRLGEPDSIPGDVAPGLLHVGVIDGQCRWPVGFPVDLPFLPILVLRRLTSPSTALKTSMIRPAAASNTHLEGIHYANGGGDKSAHLPVITPLAASRLTKRARPTVHRERRRPHEQDSAEMFTSPWLTPKADITRYLQPLSGFDPGGVTQDFRMWESYWTTSLVGGFPRSGGSPVSTALVFLHRSIHTWADESTGSPSHLPHHLRPIDTFTRCKSGFLLESVHLRVQERCLSILSLADFDSRRLKFTWSGGTSAAYTSQIASPASKTVGTPFTNLHLLIYWPVSSLANREPSTACSSQSDTRPVPRAWHNQLENGYAHIKCECITAHQEKFRVPEQRVLCRICVCICQRNVAFWCLEGVAKLHDSTSGKHSSHLEDEKNVT
ncbi:hypothetical protein PR048_031663 [Dryococelus australis]|uniref:Uncharacterized protein n=1 Tax=Dryococelus australis TaxID=614101 RepID=A0ABQ9G6K2_9NEOP|nr:hypothetical protein PR048_031663 [Dryococelus australis]